MASHCKDRRQMASHWTKRGKLALVIARTGDILASHWKDKGTTVSEPPSLLLDTERRAVSQPQAFEENFCALPKDFTCNDDMQKIR